MQLVSTFAGVYFKDVSAPLRSTCYLGPHAWYIRTNTDTVPVCKGSIQQIILDVLNNVLKFERPINIVMRMSSAFS